MRRSGSAFLALVLAAALLPAGSAGVAAVTPAAAAIAPAATVTPYTPSLTEQLAPGVVHQVGDWTTSSGDQAVHIVTVDPQAPGISLEASKPSGGIHSLQSVPVQASNVSKEGHRVIAGINGDTWATDALTLRTAPVGILVHEGELMTGSTAAKPTLGLLADETAITDDVAVTMTVTLPDGATVLAVDKINKPRANGTFVAFTRRWGTTTLTPAGGTEVVVTGLATPLALSGTWTGTVATVLPAGANTAIPWGAVVLSAQGAEAAPLAALLVGDTVTLTTATNPGWEGVQEAISGREWLARNGVAGVEPMTAPAAAVHPRTAVAVRADGTLMLAVVDGRQAPYSAGVVAADLADMLVAQGAVSAINLDGGGSTTMIARLPGDVSATVANSPSDGSVRGIDDALLVVSSLPTGTLSQVVVRPGVTTAVVGQVLPFAAKGTDASGNGVAVPAASVQWSVAGDGGTLAGAGRFAAATPGSATLQASVKAPQGTLPGSAAITVVPDTIAPVAAAPAASLRKGVTADAAATPVTLTWAAATDVGTGVAGYELEQKIGTADWAPATLATPLTRTVSLTVVPGDAVQFRVRATDNAANTGAWATGPIFQTRLVKESAAVRKYSWLLRSRSYYLDGAMRSTKVAGAAATYAFTGSSIAWIAATGPTAGSARVELDGKVISTVSLRTAAAAARRVVFSYAWSGIGRHKIIIRALGTAGHPWVNLDGFAVIDVASPYPTLSGAGDIGVCGSNYDLATARLIDQTPGTVFAAGDLAYPSGTAANFRDCYGTSWGYFKNRTMPSPGNHEYLTAGAAPYFAYFGARAGEPGKGWYAYTVGTWRIYSLNANCTIVGCGVGSEQETWLKADLAANPTACVAAVWHQPLFSSGPHGNNSGAKALWNALYAAGAEFVVNGHDHDYERFAPQTSAGVLDTAKGIREFVVGTGGAYTYALTSRKANSEVFQTGVRGIIRFTLQDGSYSWRFVPVAGSTWTDSGAGTCH